jgi:hypothetical protein
MSNAIAFYHPGKDELGIPAGRPMVFLEGRLAGFLKIKEIVRQAYPNGSYAVLEYDASALEKASSCSIEDVESVASMGMEVSIRQLYDAGFGETLVEAVNIFEGQIEEIRTKIDGKNKLIEITARDITSMMERIAVRGRRVVAGDNNADFFQGMEAIFNEDEKPNASIHTRRCNGKNYTVFEMDRDNAALWSYGGIIHYLLNEYLVSGQVGAPSLEELEAVTGFTIADELNLEGKSLARSLQICCERTDIKFRIEPSYCQVGVKSSMVFYKPGQDRCVELNHQYEGGTFDISRTNIISVESERNRWPITDRFIVQGDFKKYESTLGLIKAWDDSLEGKAQGEYGQSTSSDFDSVKDVHRKWCLNEAGDYADEPYDLGKVFEGQKYLQRRRVFQKALSRDSQGVSRGYYLEISYDNGANWQKYVAAFDVLDDECGVWLSSDELSEDVWTAINAETLKFRTTATIVSDERISFMVSNGPTDSVTQVVDHVETNDKFKYCRVKSSSIFYDQVQSGAVESDQADDTDKIAAYCNNLLRLDERTIEKIKVNSAILSLHYNPGDRIMPSPDSRDILGIRRDQRSRFVIEKVMMDVEKQQTQLEIVRKRGWQ